MHRPDPWETDPKLRAALQAVLAKRGEPLPVIDEDFPGDVCAAVARFERERKRVVDYDAQVLRRP